MILFRNSQSKFYELCTGEAIFLGAWIVSWLRFCSAIHNYILESHEHSSLLNKDDTIWLVLFSTLEVFKVPRNIILVQGSS